MAVKGTISNITPSGKKLPWGGPRTSYPTERETPMRSRVTANGSHNITDGSHVRVTNPRALDSATHRRARSIGASVGAGDRVY